MLLLLGGELFDDLAFASAVGRPVQFVVEAGQLDVRLEPLRVIGHELFELICRGLVVARGAHPHGGLVARHGGLRLELECLVEIDFRFVHASLLEQDGPEIEVGVEVGGVLLKSGPEGRYGGVGIAIFVARGAVEGAEPGEGGIEPQRVVEIFAGLGEFVEVEERGTGEHPRIGAVGHSGGLFEPRCAIARVSGADEGFAERIFKVGIGGIGRLERREHGCGVGGLAGARLGIAQKDGDPDLFGIGIVCGLELRECVWQIAFARIREAKVQMHRTQSRGQFQSGLVLLNGRVELAGVRQGRAEVDACCEDVGMRGENRLIVVNCSREVSLLLLVDGAVQLVFLSINLRRKNQYQREQTSAHRPQNSLESILPMRDNGGLVEWAMRNQSALSLFLFFCFPFFLSGVARAQAGSIPAGGGTSTTVRPDSINDLGYSGYMANSTGGVVAGDGIWGKVVVDGNPLLWEPIPVVVSCATGKTDLTTGAGPDGRFAITRVNLPTVYTLDGDVRTQMEQHFEGCAVRAELAGYRSTSDTITEHVLRDKPFLQDIVLTRQEDAPGTEISTVTGSASPEARNDMQKAHEEWTRRDTKAAEADLQQVVKIDPRFAEAWYLLGRLQAPSDVKMAAASLEQAATADPRFVLPCEWLAMIAIQGRNWQEASHWATRALELDPEGTPRIWYENAVADYRLGKNEAARVAAEHALAMDPEHRVQNTEEVLALTLVDKGDYTAALEHLRSSLSYVPAGPDAELIKRQIAFVEQRAAARK